MLMFRISKMINMNRIRKIHTINSNVNTEKMLTPSFLDFYQLKILKKLHDIFSNYKLFQFHNQIVN